MGKTIAIQNSGWMGDNDTFQHLQDGVTEFIREIHKGLLPIASQPFAIIAGYRLWGLEFTLTNSDLDLTWTAGAIFYNGQVLLIDAGTSTRSNASTHTWIYQEVVTWAQSEYEYVGGPQLDTRKTVIGSLVPVANNALGTRYNTPYLGELLGGGAWTEPSMANTDFTADTGTWTVSPASVTRTATVALNRRVMWDIFVLTSSTSGSPAELRVDLPDGMTAERLASGIGRITGTGITGSELVGWTILPSSQYVSIVRLDGTTFPASMSFAAQLSFIAQ